MRKPVKGSDESLTPEKLYQVIKNYEQEDLVCNFWKEIAGI